jgi:glutaredoxin
MSGKPITEKRLKDFLIEKKIDLIKKTNKKDKWKQSTKVDVLCLICRFKWSVFIGNLLYRRSGCPFCAKNVKRTIEDCRNYALSRNGKCLSVDYKNENSKLTWFCNKCQKPWIACASWVIYEKTWCPYCVNKHSKAEIEIFNFIKNFYPDTKNGVRGLLKNKRFEIDIWIPSLRIAIEYDGDFYHKTDYQLDKDKRKESECNEIGILLFRIKEGDYKKGPSLCLKNLLERVREIDVFEN